MHRWQRAPGSSSPTAETRPAHRSPVTSLTPFNPRASMPVMNPRQLSASSFMPSATEITSLRPSVPTPMATSTPAFSTEPPQQRLCHTPSMNTYG